MESVNAAIKVREYSTNCTQSTDAAAACDGSLSRPAVRGLQSCGAEKKSLQFPSLRVPISHTHTHFLPGQKTKKNPQEQIVIHTALSHDQLVVLLAALALNDD